ncbi:hypothetical protein WJX72_011809 [[Myrmecia] bisecta]|uniref:Uncharacterized protein n=1 Tax=[Myrmecia] bisecta TaxID=41462 RepID=A0AAW1P4R2_9CHLO
MAAAEAGSMPRPAWVPALTLPVQDDRLGMNTATSYGPLSSRTPSMHCIEELSTPASLRTTPNALSRQMSVTMRAMGASDLSTLAIPPLTTPLGSSSPQKAMRGEKIGLDSSAAVAPSQLEDYITNNMRSTYARLKKQYIAESSGADGVLSLAGTPRSSISHRSGPLTSRPSKPLRTTSVAGNRSAPVTPRTKKMAKTVGQEPSKPTAQPQPAATPRRPAALQPLRIISEDLDLATSTTSSSSRPSPRRTGISRQSSDLGRISESPRNAVLKRLFKYAGNTSSSPSLGSPEAVSNASSPRRPAILLRSQSGMEHSGQTSNASSPRRPSLSRSHSGKERADQAGAASSRRSSLSRSKSAKDRGDHPAGILRSGSHKYEPGAPRTPRGGLPISRKGVLTASTAPQEQKTGWEPISVTEAYMGQHPHVFNREVRRRALRWIRHQEKQYRAQAFANFAERVEQLEAAALRVLGVQDTNNPILRKLKERTHHQAEAKVRQAINLELEQRRLHDWNMSEVMANCAQEYRTELRENRVEEHYQLLKSLSIRNRRDAFVVPCSKPYKDCEDFAVATQQQQDLLDRSLMRDTNMLSLGRMADKMHKALSRHASDLSNSERFVAVVQASVINSKSRRLGSLDGHKTEWTPDGLALFTTQSSASPEVIPAFDKPELFRSRSLPLDGGAVFKPKDGRSSRNSVKSNASGMSIVSSLVRGGSLDFSIPGFGMEISARTRTQSIQSLGSSLGLGEIDRSKLRRVSGASAGSEVRFSGEVEDLFNSAEPPSTLPPYVIRLGARLDDREQISSGFAKWALHAVGKAAITAASCDLRDLPAQMLEANADVQQLTHLHLPHCSVTDDGLACLLDVLKEHGHLQELNVSSNQITEAGCQTLSHCLQYRPRGKAGQGVSAGLSSSLTALDLSANPIGDAGLACLEDAVCTSAHLAKLGVSRAGLTDQCALSLERFLEMAPALADLDLSWNHLTAQAVQGIVNGLTSGKRLRRLSLAWNGLEDLVVKLAKALQSGKAGALEHLDLAQTRLQPQGCLALAALLQSGYPSLLSINLSRNMLGGTQLSL